ncbi:hypothetical protein G6O67_005184 [Ophiocordyceps sinensis]|uniref:CCD97-like C-terminal domain-containing protein n=1 Tax=Ophiocordyceps sinensis TaxID=72228 RepID=A0A8H4PR33_9HYPO|nr:hypothetical protein G6O67_005184 [Ophiocordyceps sinensis]
MLSNDAVFEKPAPRHPMTGAQRARIQAQNRRREYLERNPAYFDNLDHELADPLLYERLIKKFQTPAERQAEDQAKGYGRILEADLFRGEQRLSQLGGEDSPGGTTTADDGPWRGEAVDGDDGRKLWRDYLTERFVRGRDDDFDYDPVDADLALDVLAARDAQDEWFDDEEPCWVAVDAHVGRGDDGDEQAQKCGRGETGIQDF